MKRTILFVAMISLGGVSGYFFSSLPSISRFEQRLSALSLSRKQGLNEAKLSRLASGQAVDEDLVQEELETLESQFPEGEWDNALAAVGIAPSAFVSRLREHERIIAWLERKVRERAQVEPSEITAYYESNRSMFVSPICRRARHIFFAAPNGSPPSLVAERQKMAEAVLDRLGNSETFEAIAMESEDEATRNHGGDLNFFSENRMLPEIWNALAAQKVGGPAILVRSHLGFHVLQLTDERPSREIALADARPEIVSAVENGKRLAAVEGIREGLGKDVRQ
jgi:peptidyl-prolyl cis-trans isomerase C